MNQDASKNITDVSGADLSPGEPYTCLGNGDQEFECCCDECDYMLCCLNETSPDCRNCEDKDCPRFVYK